jgi:Fanconi anaemia protein FancD2 nuclease
MPDILLEYLPSFMECVDTFFHDRDPVVARFAQAAYRQMFQIDESDRKLLLTKLIGFVCEKQVDLPFVDSDVRTDALNLLLEVNASHASALQTHALQLLRILDRTADLTVPQFRKVVELLCLVAYSKATPNEMLQEHLTMFVQKLLSSTAPVVKRQGIVGAIRIVDHTIWSDGGDDTSINCSAVSDRTIDTIAEVPEGLARNAAKLTQLMITSASAQVETLAFAYDELAAEFSPHNQRQATQKVASAFLNYWENVVNSDFLRCFIADTREFNKES